MSIVGRTYRERGLPVEILVQWGPGGGPRNVRIRRLDGTEVVRPFRGLRKFPAYYGEHAFQRVAEAVLRIPR